MDLDITFLGTAGSAPTSARGLSSVLVRRGGERLLIDCGEGTQRQLMRCTGLPEIDAIFLTHTHTDHVLGLPGMLKTFGLRDRSAPLTIFGPDGLRKFWRDIDPLLGHLNYSVNVEELSDGDIAWEGDGYVIEAVATDHTVPSLGWFLDEYDRPGHFDVDKAKSLGVTPGKDFGRLQRGEVVELDDGTKIVPDQVLGEKRYGRKIVYSGDTKPCDAIYDVSKNASLLIHEATFLEDDTQRANETGHSTALEAARIASDAKVQMLALTHISTRYMPRDILAEAKQEFESTFVARDFDLITLPFPERGTPQYSVKGARS